MLVYLLAVFFRADSLNTEGLLQGSAVYFSGLVCSVSAGDHPERLAVLLTGGASSYILFHLLLVAFPLQLRFTVATV